MRTTALLAPFAPLLSLFVAGCAGDGSSLESAAEPIINGTAANPANDVNVLLGSPAGGCSGTLVRNSWIVTARHCVFGDTGNLAGSPSTAASVTITRGADTATADRIIAHPTLDIVLLHTTAPMAVFGSTTGLDIPFWSGTNADLVGVDMLCAGYGLDQPNGFSAGHPVLRTAVLRATSADGVGLAIPPNASGQIIWHGDSGGGCRVGAALASVASSGSYTLNADGSTASVVGGFEVGTASFRAWATDIFGESAAPTNDARANATELAMVLNGRTGTGTFETETGGSTLHATQDGPTAGSCTTGANVWYRFTLTDTRVVYLDTSGSAFDTSLLLTNAAGAPLGSTWTSDDAGCTGGGFTSVRQSRVYGVLSAGTYYVAVGGCGAGAFQLRAQSLPMSGSYVYTAALAGDSTTSTTLIGNTRSVGSCGGLLGGEDYRWFVSCGAQPSLFSLCSADGGSYTAVSGSSRWEPVLYVRSAQSGSELACNANAVGTGVSSCVGAGGTPAADHGARIQGLTATRGLNALFVDNNTGTAGMGYTLRYTVR